MKKALLVGFATLLLFTASGCYGPQKMTRMFDDWGNATYSDSPWLAQGLFYTTVFPVGYFLCSVVDWFVLNPIDFWTSSAWKSRGTVFEHPPTPGVAPKK